MIYFFFKDKEINNVVGFICNFSSKEIEKDKIIL